jgi:hypothetical protein
VAFLHHYIYKYYLIFTLNGHLFVQSITIIVHLMYSLRFMQVASGLPTVHCTGDYCDNWGKGRGTLHDTPHSLQERDEENSTIMIKYSHSVTTTPSSAGASKSHIAAGSCLVAGRPWRGCRCPCTGPAAGAGRRGTAACGRCPTRWPTRRSGCPRSPRSTACRPSPGPGRPLGEESSTTAKQQQQR